MSESRLRSNVTKILAHRDAKPVENPAWPGFPDVNYVEGLLELKCVSKWPSRPDTPLQLPHFTQQQRIFLRRRWAAGGNAYLLLQVGRAYLLFKGLDVQHVGRILNKEVLLKRAHALFSDLSDLKSNLDKWIHRGNP